MAKVPNENLPLSAIGMFPSDWQEATLASICHQVTDGTHDSPKPVAEGGFPLVTGKAIKDRRIDFAVTYNISEEDHRQVLARSKAEEGDILFANIGNSIGDLVRVQTSRPFSIKNVALFKPNQEKVDPRYLEYYFLSEQVQTFIKGTTRGSAQPFIGLSSLRGFPVALPQMNEQIGIGSILGVLDDRIVLLRETNATLEAIAQALFKSWFVDFDPVHARARGKQPAGLAPEIAALFPDSFEELDLGMMPSGWKVQHMDAWLDVLETGRRPKGGVSGIVDGVPSIGAESIVSIGTFDYGKTKFVPDDFFSKMRSGVLQSHDVLLYKDGGKPGVFLPRVSMFGDDFPFARCCINEHVFRIRVKPPMGQAFLYFWLWSDAVMHELKHRGGKAAIPGINQSDVRELKLVVPHEGLLGEFERLTSPLINQIFLNAKQAQTLANLRDTLLPRLISGQLRLPDAEQQLKDLAV